jgi:DNA helicase-2/ATP-dependent DNA helicase PcrA
MLMKDAIARGAYGNRTEDEARLFYTAITRAERLLYLTGSEIHPNLKVKKKQSVFTSELKHEEMREDMTLDDLADKINPMPRFDDNEPTDFSSVKSYLTCPFMYKLQNIYGYNAAVPELFGFGQTTHTILERLHQKYKNRIPTDNEIFDLVEDTFMLKHVFRSKDPINRPGSYERAKDLVHNIVKQYVDAYSDDFCRIRQDEARFELLVDNALITGSIDLLFKEDKSKNISSAEVIDFKSMDVPDELKFDWREMSIQVQLYSRAAKEVIGENAETGYIHTLKNNKRVKVPVDEISVKNAIDAIEWAVKGIMQGDFPMRACATNCSNCDYKALCRQKREEFKRKEVPPMINTPVGERIIAAFDGEDGEAYI